MDVLCWPILVRLAPSVTLCFGVGEVTDSVLSVSHRDVQMETHKLIALGISQHRARTCQNEIHLWDITAKYDNPGEILYLSSFYSMVAKILLGPHWPLVLKEEIKKEVKKEYCVLSHAIQFIWPKGEMEFLYNNLKQSTQILYPAVVFCTGYLKLMILKIYIQK